MRLCIGDRSLLEDWLLNSSNRLLCGYHHTLLPAPSLWPNSSASRLEGLGKLSVISNRKYFMFPQYNYLAIVQCCYYQLSPLYFSMSHIKFPISFFIIIFEWNRKVGKWKGEEWGHDGDVLGRKRGKKCMVAWKKDLKKNDRQWKKKTDRGKTKQFGQ